MDHRGIYFTVNQQLVHSGMVRSDLGLRPGILNFIFVGVLLGYQWAHTTNSGACIFSSEMNSTMTVLGVKSDRFANRFFILSLYRAGINMYTLTWLHKVVIAHDNGDMRMMAIHRFMCDVIVYNDDS